MEVTLYGKIISEVQTLLKSDDIQNPDCISIYEVYKLGKTKYNAFKKLEKEYENKMDNALKRDISNSSYIVLYNFDYDKLELRTNFKYYPTSFDREIYFSKNAGDLYITKAEHDEYNEAILFSIGNFLSELYDIYIEFSDLLEQREYNVKSVNSSFLIDIYSHGTEIAIKSKENRFDDAFNLKYNNILKEFKYVCNSNTLINNIKGKEDELFKKVFIKIDDCPKWMQKQLYEIRKIELLSLESDISKKEKAQKKEINNYERLLNEIKKFLNKKEVSQENTLTEVISLFELYNIVNDELEDLRNIFENSELEKRFIKSTNIFCRSKLDLVLWGEQDSSRLRLFGYNGCMLDICKDKNINEIYFNRHITDDNKNLYKFVKKNYELILKTLLKLEEYEILIGNINAPNSSKIIGFDNNLFKVSLSYDTLGKVFVNIEMNGDHELEKEYYKKWYERENISDFVNKNKDEVLKRIPVDPYELDESFKKIYDRYKEKLQKQKVKEIRKSKGI